jgi:uncharacterized protein YukJ
MPVPNYSVLKGDPQRGEVAFDRAGKNPHYRIYMADGSQADVNIESSDGSEILYVIVNPFTPPGAGNLDQLAIGITALDRVPGGLALDYVREQIGSQPMVNRADMTLLPIPTQQPQDQLKNAVIQLLNQAVADENGTIYAFGSAYSDPNGAKGVHNIHMNQGNPLNGGFADDNGIWQDGALFVNLPAAGQWTALFIAFQTQSWQTDDAGNPD